jgi:hypothetical protein
VTAVYVVDGQPVDFDTYVKTYIERGRPAGLARVLAGIADDRKRRSAKHRTA